MIADMVKLATADLTADVPSELTALIGYYAMVALTLNAHEIGVPDGATPPLPDLDARR